MGSTTWRNLSVLLLASAALVGCNNTSPRDGTLGAGKKVGDPPVFAGNQNTQPFPKAGTPGGAANGGQPNSPFGPGPGANITPGGNAFGTPAGGNLNNNTPNSTFAPIGGGAPRPETPKEISLPGNGGNANPMPYPNSGGIMPPPRNDVFGSARPDTPDVPTRNAPFNGPVINQPAGWNPK